MNDLLKHRILASACNGANVTEIVPGIALNRANLGQIFRRNNSLPLQPELPAVRHRVSYVNISTIIWAIGYSFDFSLVKLPVVDADGYPLQKRGVTAYEGLYFLGMPWLHTRRSGILFGVGDGVGDDAAYLAAHIAARKDEREVPHSYEQTIATLRTSELEFLPAISKRRNTMGCESCPIDSTDTIRVTRRFLLDYLNLGTPEKAN